MTTTIGTTTCTSCDTIYRKSDENTVDYFNQQNEVWQCADSIAYDEYFYDVETTTNGTQEWCYQCYLSYSTIATNGLAYEVAI